MLFLLLFALTLEGEAVFADGVAPRTWQVAKLRLATTDAKEARIRITAGPLQFEKSFSLPAHTKTTIEVPFYLPAPATLIKVSIITPEREEFYPQIAEWLMNAFRVDPNITVASLSGNFGARIDLQSFSPNPHLLAGFKLIVLTEEQWRALSPEWKQAFRRYLGAGGRIHLLAEQKPADIPCTSWGRKPPPLPKPFRLEFEPLVPDRYRDVGMRWFALLLVVAGGFFGVSVLWRVMGKAALAVVAGTLGAGCTAAVLLWPPQLWRITGTVFWRGRFNLTYYASGRYDLKKQRLLYAPDGAVATALRTTRKVFYEGMRPVAAEGDVLLIAPAALTPYGKSADHVAGRAGRWSRVWVQGQRGSIDGRGAWRGEVVGLLEQKTGIRLWWLLRFCDFEAEVLEGARWPDATGSRMSVLRLSDLPPGR